MLKQSNQNAALIFGVLLIMAIDFIANVWVGNGNEKKTLGVSNWNKSILIGNESLQIPPLNELFGLKAETSVLEEKERLRLLKEQEDAEKLARELARKNKEKEILSIGEQDIRLFGITFSGEQKFALFNIKSAKNGESVLKLASGELLAVKDETFFIRIEDVRHDSVQLLIENTQTQEKNIINLAMFKYEL